MSPLYQYNYPTGTRGSRLPQARLIGHENRVENLESCKTLNNQVTQEVNLINWKKMIYYEVVNLLKWED